MKKSPLLLLFFSFFFAADAQTINNANLVVGKVDSIHSKILNENRKIWISAPANNPMNATHHSPILYLLDGNIHFNTVATMVQYLSDVRRQVVPEMIIVGIPNTNRMRDLTPSDPTIDASGKPKPGTPATGGSEKFAAFIEKELMPHIDSLYQPAPYKTIVGHSLGGLVVMDILMHHPNMFNAFVAIDPSMWWDSRKLLTETKAALSQKRFEGKSLFMAIANTMPAHMDTIIVRNDTTDITNHIRSILLLKDAIKSNAANGLKFDYKYYNDDAHTTVPFIAEYDALHFIFKNYSFTEEETEILYDTTAKFDVAKSIVSHYEPYNILPPQSIINNFGNTFMAKNMPNRALAVFNLNLNNYPNSFNANSNMGDYYKNIKDKDKAIQYYTKALSILENADARTKLKLLREQN